MITKWKTFAQEAGLYVDVNGHPWPRNMNGEDIEGAYAKFAELIVKECATAIINDSRLSDVRSAVNGCVRTIREHFGVES